MSFRGRLFIFFTIIVVVPMAAVAVVQFKLTSQSETGKTDARVAQPAGTPSIPGFWQLMGAATKVTASPFAGANPHAVLA